MKIIDIRNTQSQGWVADVFLSEYSINPVSIPVLECDPFALMEYANTDPEHIRFGDVRLPIEIEMDTLYRENKETYQSLL